MMVRSRRAITLLVACVIMLSNHPATGSRSLSFAPSGETITSTVTFLFQTYEIICNMTIARTLPRAISKRSGTSMGRVTRVTISECLYRGRRYPESGLEISMVALAPGTRWSVSYSAFLGTLPTITGVRYDISEALILYIVNEIFGSIRECLYRGTIGMLADVSERRIEREHILTAFTSLERVRGVEESFCHREATLEGTFTVSPPVRIELM